jgi:hypothetical protein
MKARLIPLAIALIPAAAFAQASYSRAEIVGPRLNVCDVEHRELWDRKAALTVDQQAIDRERDAIERESALLSGELRALDNADTAAVAAYNARSAAHNRRVADHNRYVNATNRAAALLNGDSAEFLHYCETLRYARR